MNNSTDILVYFQNISLKNKFCLNLTLSFHEFTQMRKLPTFNRPHTTTPINRNQIW